jgi:hypothetical protein
MNHHVRRFSAAKSSNVQIKSTTVTVGEPVVETTSSSGDVLSPEGDKVVIKRVRTKLQNRMLEINNNLRGHRIPRSMVTTSD